MPTTTFVPSGNDYAPSPRRLPNSIADDVRLGPKPLCLLTYRVAHAGTFGLNVRDAKNRFGMGARTFYKSLARLQELGYLSRSQSGPRPTGGFGYAVDHVDLAATPDGRQGYVIWTRDSFDKLFGLPSDLIGILIYLHGQAPIYPVTAQNVARRFGISERTAKKHLSNLVLKELVTLRARRDACGRYMATSFFAVRHLRPQRDISFFEDWIFRVPDQCGESKRSLETYQHADFHIEECYHDVSDDQIRQRLMALVLSGRMLPRLLEDECSLHVLKKIMVVQEHLADLSVEEAVDCVLSLAQAWCHANPSRMFKSWGLIGIPVLTGRHVDFEPCNPPIA